MREDPQMVVFVSVAAFLLVAAFVVLFVRWFRGEGKTPPAPAPAVDVTPAAATVPAFVDMRPRCRCGELATEPAPILARERGSSLRDFFGMPPRYRRVVGRKAAWWWDGDPLVLCRPHAHSADADMTRWLADQRAQTAAAFSRMAQEAAVYETVGLMQAVDASLTGAQLTRAEAARTPKRTAANGAGAAN